MDNKARLSQDIERVNQQIREVNIDHQSHAGYFGNECIRLA